MKALLRSSLLALIVFAGFAAVSARQSPSAVPGTTSPCGPARPNMSLCVK
jgi:hypothetical protein